MRKIYTLFVATVTTTSLMAQLVRITPGEDTTKAKELEQVIVTGQYKPQSAKNSVYQVRTISKERIQKQGATKLQDVLNNELNIRFSQDLSTGGSGITMMGLKGQNVKILIDGVPMVGRQGTTNEIDINQIDINSIERIEIVEGPMSVVYGADALAGVINIITRKNSTSKISVKARLQEETIGREYGIQQGIHTQLA
jgi:outer membrane receptor for ferrienterochelin and colicins